MAGERVTETNSTEKMSTTGTEKYHFAGMNKKKSNSGSAVEKVKNYLGKL